jgi:ABC-type multidrug transport system fused ATPase/permease subunit
VITTAWGLVAPFLDHPRRKIASMVGLSGVAGAIEASVLVIVVDIALAVSGGEDLDAMSIPLIGATVSAVMLAIVALVLAFVLVAVHAAIAHLGTSVAADVLEATRHESLHGFVKASWPAQSERRDGELQETTMVLARQSSVLTLTLSNGLAAGVSLLPLLIAALVIDPVTLLVVAVVGGLLFALIRPIGALTNRRAQDLVRANADFNENITRLASMAMETRIFGTQRRVLEQLDADNQRVKEQYHSTRFVSVFGSTLYRDIALLCLVIAVAALTQVGSGNIDAIGAVVLLMVRALAYFSMVNTALQQLNEQVPSVEELEQRLATLKESEEPLGHVHLDHVGDIVLSDVEYTYGDDRHVLRGTDLEIPLGTTLGIIGPSGAGKSTLLQVLMRLRRPTSGHITVGSTPYADIRHDDWSRLIAFVPQEPTLMEASIRENIRFFRPELDDSVIEIAADLAHVGDEIRRLPRGFDTPLGPRGSGLSGGQKQRLAIARALAGSPELIVFDEPTSALDTESETRIHETINGLKGTVTIVIVAHRGTTLDLCERIVDVRDIGGMLAEPDAG